MVAIAAIAVVVVPTVSGCRPLEGPTTEKAKAPVSAPSLEATLSAETGPEGPWPEKVGRFSVSSEGATGHPTDRPDGFEIDTVDVIELEPETGLVCNVVLLKGNEAIVFMQGSPLARQYGIDPVDTVPWAAHPGRRWSMRTRPTRLHRR